MLEVRVLDRPFLAGFAGGGQFFVVLDGRSQPLDFFAGGTLAGLVAALAHVGIVGLGPQVTHTLLGLFQVFFQLGLTAEGIRAGTGAPSCRLGQWCPDRPVPHS